MAEIAEIKQWCNEARKILGRMGKDSRGKMEGRSSEVAKLLARLKVVKGAELAYAGLLKDYEAISARALSAAKSGDKAAVAEASRDLSVLKNSLRIELAKDPAASKSTLKEGAKGQQRMQSQSKQEWASDKADRDAELEKDRLELLARQVLGDALMTKRPVDASDEEVLAAGVQAARDAVNDALKDRNTRVEDDVNRARALLPAVQLALTQAEQAATARLKQAYLSAYAAIRSNFEAGLKVYQLKATKFALLSRAFETAYAARSTAVTAQDWVKALAAVPAENAAATALKNAGAAALAEKPAFERGFRNLRNLVAAQNIAKAPPLSLRTAQAQVFREKYQAVNDARNTGEFLAAQNAISALQLAITNLIEANRLISADKLAFEQALALIPAYAEAKLLAAGNSPAVTDKIAAFTLADGQVEAKTKLQDWAAAKDLVEALKTATGELIAARTGFNSSYGEPKKLLFAQQLKALEPRTQLADTAGPTSFVDGLKRVVKERLLKIGTAVSASDPASAELLHTQLLLDLAAMEGALREYKEHFTKFDSAKKGAVKTALEFVLTPPKLGLERDKALAVTEKRIQHFADKGSISAKADPLVASWIEEANAWKSAQAASENLNSGAEPDSGVLQTLAALPGGGKVLDALMDGLPDGKPEKFIKEAIKIRYGIDVKRFQKKNPDNVTVETGLTVISPDVPDKDLRRMYQMFGKVPMGNVKGKVTELIHFDENDNGAAALGGKIWMYCGRANDPNGSKQKFGDCVVPAGEEIDEAFQAATGDDIPDEIPYFDFAAMHEVGHAVDEAKEIMSKQPPGQIAGWKKHTRDKVAEIAAAHFKYNLDYVKRTLANKSSTPPTTVYPPEGGATQTDWDKARDQVLDWCKSVRVGMSIWNNPALSRHVAIGGRVYQEAYDNDWVSYELAARSKGITSYQFRSPAEWFAELYAAYFSGKLKKTHPYAEWLKPLKKIS